MTPRVAYLKLTEDVDEDAAVKHRLAVDRGDEVGDLLEGEGLDLFHDLDGALHLQTLEGHQGGLRVVQGLQLRS